MRKILIDFLKYILFWLIYFWLSKLIFLLFNYNLTNSLSYVELQKIFILGSKLDLSMSSYLAVLPGIMFAISIIFPPKTNLALLKIYTLIILVIATFLNIIDLGLYPHWGTRVGISAFDYLNDPKGMIANIIWTDAFLAIIVASLYIIVFIWIFKRLFKENHRQVSLKEWYVVPLMLFLTACLILPIRGGLSTSPINQSSVSFSNKLYVNHSASNYLWNFFQTVDQRKKMENPCDYFEADEAIRIFNKVENQRTFEDSVFIHPKENVSPNVLLIILESFSDKVISSLGGEYHVCPNLDSICSESVIFPEFYASGNRSDRGMSALLASYPSLLSTSIIRFPDKSDQMPMISDYFNRNNYESTFYYGGDINFYNMKSIVLQGDYNEIVAQNEFPSKLQNLSKWGVPDGFLFDRVLNDMNQKKRPFFTVAYTLSSHPPYDVPVQIIQGQSNESKYLNSVAYTDSCLGAFIRALKNTDDWDNTLVVITADHGALYPGPTEIIDPETYRIPLIWTGGVIQNSRIINRFGGQPDLMPTLIRQLGGQPDSILFGHDLFSSPSYAFYMTESGWGYVSEAGSYYFDQTNQDFKIFNQAENAKPDFNFAKSYLQVLHHDFLSK